MSQPESESDTDRELLEPITAQLLQPTIRLILALVVLGVLMALLTRVPGTDRVIFDPDITVAIVLFSAIVLIMFGALLNYATVVGKTLSSHFPDFAEFERIVQLVALFVVIVAAHRVFWWLPYFRENPAHYDLLFLILGLTVGGWLGYLLYINVDDFSEMFTEHIVTEERATTAGGNSARDEIETKTDGLLDGSSDVFRTSGGTDTPVSPHGDTTPTDAPVESDESKVDTCSDCGVYLPDGAQVCHECGNEL